jgi:hypothetical protein
MYSYRAEKHTIRKNVIDGLLFRVDYDRLMIGRIAFSRDQLQVAVYFRRLGSMVISSLHHSLSLAREAYSMFMAQNSVTSLIRHQRANGKGPG